MSIAVIIPSHNRAALLPRALDSVLAQHHPATEIFVVDDGSTDDTASLIRTSYRGAVHYLRQPNAGVSAARNRGVRSATADWLAFLDSDDAWRPDKLAVQWRELQSHPACRVIHSDELWVRAGRRVNPGEKHRKHGGNIYRQCLPLCAISPSAVMIHREVFDDVGLFDELLPACEDYDLWLRDTAKYPVHYVDQPLIVKYGGHQGQLSQRYWGMDRFRIRGLVKMLEAGSLSAKDRAATVETLRDKIDVYMQGARKRGKHEEVENYAALKDRHCPVAALV